MAETIVQKQVRLVLEQQCHDLTVLLKSKVPAGVGFTLFLSDYGEGGNLAYCSTVDRQDAIRMVREWLDTRDEHADVDENDLLRRDNSALREKARRADALFTAICNSPSELDKLADEPTDAELREVGKLMASQVEQLKFLLAEMAR